MNDPYFKVIVLNKTYSPNELCYMALHNDYSEIPLSEQLDKIPSERKCGEIIVNRLLNGGRGHYGCLEHPHITFSCEYFPHSVVVQARTHRVAVSFDVQCLSGDTLVSVKNGRVDQFKKVSDLYELWSSGRKHMQGYPKEIARQQQIIKLSQIRNMDEDTQEVSYTSIQNMFYGGQKELFAVMLSNGKSVECSMEHRLLTDSGWKQLKDISLGEKLYVRETVYPIRQKGVYLWLSTDELASEIWKPVENTNYEVSSLGRVKNCVTKQLKALTEAKNGYLIVGLSKKGVESKVYVHKLVLEAFSIPYPGKGYEARHLDSNPFNNRWDNLEWGSVKENKDDQRKSIGFHESKFVEYPIVNITSVGFQDCYDIEVIAPHHNFLANNIVVHNSQRYTSKRVKQLVEGDLEFDKVLFVRPIGQYKDRQGKDFFYSAMRQQRSKERMLKTANWYVQDVDEGMPEEQARGELCQDIRQNFVVTFNARSLMHFLDMRAKADAQPEIQMLCELLLPYFVAWMPEVAEYYITHRWKKAKLAP